mgnify:FL=1
MCFSRKSQPSIPLYLLNKEPLKVVDNVKDLGIYLDKKLSFVDHYDYIVARSRKILGCIKRWTANFKNIRSIVILFNSLVRSILEFNCISWSPFYITYINRIDAVQRSFLRFVKFKLYSNGLILDNIDLVASYLSIPSLETRRTYHKLCFLFKLLNGIIDAPELLCQVGINVPIRNVRGTRSFYTPFHKFNYALHSPLNSILAIANKHNSLNYFGVSFTAFKRECQNLILKC